jgi:Cyclin, N-terminal domain/Cyclin, C-terminal domain
MEDTVATIAAMCRQEASGYITADFLRQSYNGLPVPLDVDEDCRKKMAAWSYQVVDFCKFNRETVEIAMSYLDRFLLTASGIVALQDRSVFQLAAMTSLYTAVKIHEPEAMDPKLVSSLSRGAYAPEDIEHMEIVLLQALHWRVNPPTSLAFVREFFHLIPAGAMDEATRTMVYDITKFQTELTVSDYDFISVKASVAAYCSFMNSLESLELDPKVIQYVGFILQEAVGINNSCIDQILDVQRYLYSAVVVQPALPMTAAQQHPTSPKPEGQRTFFTISPRSSILESSY